MGDTQIKRRQSSKVAYSKQLFQQIAWSKLPTPTPEYRFCETRRWRFDYAYPTEKIGIEYEGVISQGKSRHTTIKGYTEDCRKYNTAQLMGWTVLRFTALQVKSGEALDTIEMALNGIMSAPDERTVEISET